MAFVEGQGSHLLLWFLVISMGNFVRVVSRFAFSLLINMQHFDIDFLLFIFFRSELFINGFPNSLIVHSRSSYLLSQ